MAGAQPQQLGAGVPGGAGHAHLHGPRPRAPARSSPSLDAILQLYAIFCINMHHRSHPVGPVRTGAPADAMAGRPGSRHRVADRGRSGNPSPTPRPSPSGSTTLPHRPRSPRPVGPDRADLAIVGGGYTGLWTALLAKEARPDDDVVVLEADRCGWAASGRNGGFCAASLTHGLANGIEHFADEVASSSAWAARTSTPSRARFGAWRIDCDFERNGDLTVATEPYQVDALAEDARVAARYGVRSRPPRGGGRAGRGRLPHLPGRPLGPDRLRSCQPCPAGLGLALTMPATRRAHLRAQPRSIMSSAPMRDPPGPIVLSHRSRPGPSYAGGAGHERPSVAGSPASPLRRACLRLRAHDRAAQPRATACHRMAATGRAWAAPATNSSTTG